MAAETRSVVVRLSMEAAQYIRDAQRVGKVGSDAMSQIEGGAKRGSAQLDHMGTQFGKVALVAAGGLAAVGKAAVDWQSQFAGVTKTVDGTASELGELEDGLRGLAKTLPATHEEIAGVAEAAGQLGVAREDILDFTKVMIDLGETTNLTAEDAATSIAQMANVMGTAGDEIDNLGASLVAVGNAGASTERQIIEMAQGISGAAAIVGLSESEVLGIANAIASIGIEVEAGGSSISRVLTSMGKATAQGGAKLKVFAEVAGVSAEDFAKSFKETPADALVSFVQGLGKINDTGGDVFTTLDKLGFADVRVSRALLGMAADSDKFAGSIDLAGKAWEENTALTDEAAKRYETAAAKTQVAWNNMKDAAIEAGAVLLPIISDVAEKVAFLADVFGSLPKPVQSSLVELLGIATLLGGAAFISLKTISAVRDLQAGLAGIAATSPKAAAGLKGLGAAGAALIAIDIAGKIYEAIHKEADLALPSIEGVTAAILALGTAAGGDIEDGEIRELMDFLNDPGAWAATTQAIDGALDSLGDFGSGLKGIASVTGGAGWLAEIDRQSEKAEVAAEKIKLLDEAFAGLVGSGGMEVAQERFAALAAQQDLSAEEQEKLLDLMPAYTDALLGAENAAAIAAVGTNGLKIEIFGLSGAVKENTDLAGANAKAIAKQAAALTKSRKAARETAQEFIGLGDSLNDSKVSLGEWLTDLEKQNEALRNFRINAKKAAKEGLDEGFIKSLQKAGPEGALRMKELANATDAEIRRANRAWRKGQREVGLYTDAVGGVPKDAGTDFHVTGVPEAKHQITTLQELLGGVHDKTVTINVKKVIHDIFSAEGNFFPAGMSYANGGDVRNGHQPQVAAGGSMRVWAEAETGGETYIPHANDSRRPMAKRYLESTAQLFGGQVQWFADGAQLAAIGSRSGAGYMTGGSTTRGAGPASMVVSGTLQTPWGPAHIEGLARDVAREEIDADSRFEKTRRGK